MNLIEKWGLEKCQAIVDGAPKWAKSYCIEAADYWNEESKYPCCVDVSDLRTAIADHDRTDHCSDIANHISLNTKVIER